MLALLPILLVVIAAVYVMLTPWLVERDDRRVPRDPATGIMIGAETRDLGPRNAPGVAIFVHGFAGSGNNFNELPDRLAREGWRVRVMRLPGHGTSPRDLERVGADELLRAVLAEIDAMKRDHQRIVLVGHSMGGALCALAASQRDVDGLVLGGAYFGVTHRWYYGLRPETWTELTSPLVRWIYKGKRFLQVNDRSVKDKIVAYTWLPSKAGLTLNEIGRRVNEAAVLESIRCPVLMIHSRRDVAASPQAAERALHAMASERKRLVWVDRSNHHVFWDYEAETVAREVESFLGRPG